MSSGGEENSPREAKERKQAKILKQEPAEDKKASYSESSYSTEEATEPADSKDREGVTADPASRS